jgi:2-haloalkanoic acid dehalogenase type II
LFDLGQTLVDLDGLVACIARRLGLEHPELSNQKDALAARWIRTTFESLPRGPQSPFEREIDVAAQVLADLLIRAGVPASTDSAEGTLRRAWDDFEKEVQFCPGVTSSWLEEVQGLSAGLAIVTDGDSVNVDRLVRHLGLAKYFDAIITSEEIRAYKPDPRLYVAAAETLRARPENCLFVSDTALDLRGAAALGMRTAYLPRRLLSQDADLPNNAVHLARPAELIDILRNSKPGASGRGRS